MRNLKDSKKIVIKREDLFMWMDLLTNPVVISVAILLVLSMLRLNIVFAIVIAAFSGGAIAGLGAFA